jgi:hypothetical protein
VSKEGGLYPIRAAEPFFPTSTNFYKANFIKSKSFIPSGTPSAAMFITGDFVFVFSGAAGV